MERNGLCTGILVLLILASALLAGCTKVPDYKLAPPIPTEGTPVSITVNGTAVAAADNQFGYELYTRLGSDPANAGSNLFFSPFSISSALALTYEGARGTTADEIRSVFHFPASPAIMRQGFREIDAGLDSGPGSNYTLATANALWAEKSFAFLPAYTGTAREYYGANTTNLDFIGQPEASRQTINQWVADKTANRIQNLIPAGAIDPLTRLVITNAIYFKGNWVHPFDKQNTKQADFLVTPQKTVQVPMMALSDPETSFNYTETGDLQVLEMPYAHRTGDALSMLVFLPKDNGLAPAEAALSPGNLTAIRNTLLPRPVIVSFPKFTVETGYRLPGTLSAMGMPTAFSRSADFSGMDGKTDLYISDVIHKAFVNVDEEGTEAAAATAVVMRAQAVVARPTVFNADHPFVFVIQDDTTGAILFVGRINNPSGS